MPITPDIAKTEAAIIEQTNAFRATARLGALKPDTALAKAAREYARFLAASTVFSHEADGRRPVDRSKAAGYQPCSVAENLAWHFDSRGFETLQLATMNVEGWKSSPSHRKNLLLPHATETGVAIVKARQEPKYYAVQLMGRPASLQYTFEIENGSGREVVYKVAGEENRIAPRMLVRHTACTPAEVTFQIARGGLLTKEVVARYDARGGAVFRLRTAKGGELLVEVGRQ